MSVDDAPSSVVAALEGADDAERTRALMALERGEADIDHAIVRLLVVLLGDPRKAVSRRAAAALALAVAEPAHLTAVESALGDADARRRWGAAFALARAGMRNEAVMRAAVMALDARDGDVRWAAAEIVCDIAGSLGHLRPLVEDAAVSGGPERRKMGLYCLRDLGHEDSAVFRAALSDSDRGVRLAALAGLVRCAGSSGEGADVIVDVMAHDADVGVRRAAAATLGRMALDDQHVTDALGHARDASEDDDFIRAATAALERRGRTENDHE